MNRPLAMVPRTAGPPTGIDKDKSLEKLKKKYQPQVRSKGLENVPSYASLPSLSQSKLIRSAEKQRRVEAGVEYVSPYSQKSSKEKIKRESSSVDTKSEDPTKKAKSWQLRFVGMAKTIKNLESLNREKSETIGLLETALNEKDRIIENLQSRLEADRNRSYVSQSVSGILPGTSSILQRGKEKEMEKKVKELEGVIAKDKKQITRLVEVNSQLVARAKGNDAVVEEWRNANSELKGNAKLLEDSIAEHQHENDA